MERHFKSVFSLVILLEVIFVRCEYFTVVGSKTLRADEPYLVAVTSHSLNAESRTFSVGIDGHSFSGDYHEVHEEVTVSPGKCELTLVHVSKACFEASKAFLKNFSCGLDSQLVQRLVPTESF